MVESLLTMTAGILIKIVYSHNDSIIILFLKHIRFNNKFYGYSLINIYLGYIQGGKPIYKKNSTFSLYFLLNVYSFYLRELGI